MAKSFDSEFEQWYRMEKAAKEYAEAKEKDKGNVHQIGDVVRQGSSAWIITGVQGVEGPAWRFAGKEESSGAAVSIHCLSLRQMGGNWQFLDKFQQRARLLKNVRVDGVPKLLQSFEADTESDKAYYMIFESPSDVTLQDLLDAGLRPTEEEIMEIGVAVLEIMEELYEKRPPVYHSAITPDNILISAESRREGGRGIWLSGFVPDDKSRTRALAEGYLPPNSLLRPPSADDDVFSVGAVMLRMLSGRDPVEFLVQEKSGLGMMSIRFRGEVVMSSRLAKVVDEMLAFNSPVFRSPQSALVSLKQAASAKTVRGSKCRVATMTSACVHRKP